MRATQAPRRAQRGHSVNEGHPSPSRLTAPSVASPALEHSPHTSLLWVNLVVLLHALHARQPLCWVTSTALGSSWRSPLFSPPGPALFPSPPRSLPPSPHRASARCCGPSPPPTTPTTGRSPRPSRPQPAGGCATSRSSSSPTWCGRWRSCARTSGRCSRAQPGGPCGLITALQCSPDALQMQLSMCAMCAMHHIRGVIEGRPLLRGAAGGGRAESGVGDWRQAGWRGALHCCAWSGCLEGVLARGHSARAESSCPVPMLC
jgi:hypothetical protein